MIRDHASPGFEVRSRAGMAAALADGARSQGRWQFICRGLDGKVKWVDEIPDNLVVNQGLDHLLSAALAGGTQITAWYLGLIDATPTIAGGDTLASHAGWAEVSDYTGDRKAWTAGSVSGQSVSNSASVASFAINASVTVGGAFLASVATGTAGTLYAAGAFAGGNRALQNGDTLEVTATFTTAAA